MFRIFITAKALADAYLQDGSKSYEEQSEWFHILRKQREIYTIGYFIPSSDVFMEDDLSDSGIIAKMASACGINIIPADEYLEDVKKDNSRVYDYPNAAFFLDVAPEVAEEIQKEYGVIFQSSSFGIDTSVFTEECIELEFKQGNEVSGGWEELFKVQSKVPSNALCVIDRYLFCYDGQKNKFKPGLINNGLDTIFLILKNALPSHFNCTYHFTVICDKNQITYHSFQTLQDILFKYVESISKDKGYPIFAQLIAIDDTKAKNTHSLTHNRQVISNYHKMDFSNGVNAIWLQGKKKAIYTQSLQGKLLYGTGLKHLISQCPVDSITITQNTAKTILQQWMSDQNAYVEHFLYADNKGNTSIKNIENRLFL